MPSYHRWAILSDQEKNSLSLTREFAANNNMQHACCTHGDGDERLEAAEVATISA